MDLPNRPTDETDLRLALRCRQLPGGDLLDPLPFAARRLCWSRLLRASERSLTVWKASQEGRSWRPDPLPTLPPPVSEPVRPGAPPRLHRQVKREALVLLAALDVFLWCPAERAAALVRVREQIVRLAQLYALFEPQTWEGVAFQLFDWELRLLVYRDSAVLAPLVWPRSSAA